jgi:quercetin dioxygenase-like cupin family protein
VVFTNPWVRIFDVIVKPGDSTLYHVHSNDYVFVTFGAVSLKSQLKGGEKADLNLADGEVRFTAGPITHRVLDPGTIPFHNLTIELLKTSGVPLAKDPPGKTELDNAKVRVQRIELQPGQSVSRHAHPGPMLLVGVTNGTLSISTGAGQTERRAIKPGFYRWNDAGRAHTISNTGQTAVQFLEIEWK